METKQTQRKADNGKIGVRLILFTGVIVALSSAVSVGLVRAQAETVIAVTPSEGNLWLNAANTVEMEIMISDVVDLQGFDLTITYDPLIVQLAGWAYDDFLTSLVTVSHVETSGSIRLAAVQLAGSPASGEGILFTLTFSGLMPGESAIMIAESKLTTDAGIPIEHACLGGVIRSAYDLLLLPQFDLIGEVSLQGQSHSGGVLVSLAPGDVYQVGPYSTVSLDQESENLNFGDVIADTYALTTEQPRYLNVTLALGKSVTVTEGGSVVSLLTLLAGNAVWTDNIINVADASLVGANYGMTVDDLPPGEVLDADVNFDGVVNLRDLALVAGNYGLDSAAAYQAWMP
jgi:hypothetical protein